MCRLFAFKSSKPIKTSLYLERAKDAFEKQSHRDSLGHKNLDGWGFGFFEEKIPKIKKNYHAAWHDREFEDFADKINTDLLISHIRAASVGTPKIENCHPFAYQDFIFAQNGTMSGFEKFKKALLAEIDNDLKSEIQGDTDTEHLFFMILTNLRKKCGDLKNAKKDEITTAIRETLKCVENFYFKYSPDAQRPGFNIVFSDGKNLVTTRFNRTLFICEKDPETPKPKGVYSQEHHWHVDFGTDDHRYHKIILASEKITPTDSDWDEIPENSIVSIDEDFGIKIEHLRLSL